MNKSTLFVGDLTTTCTEADLEEVFSSVGPVRHVRIQRTQGKQQTSLGYGFVKMGTPVAASRAMVALDGFLMFGRKLRIRLAAYRIGNNNKMEEKVQPTNSLYVKFVGTIPGASTNEEKIRDIFSVCGNLEDVNIRKTSFEKRKK